MSTSHPLSIASDNHAPIAPKILEAIIDANHGSAAAYGTDEASKEAHETFKQAFGPDARTHLVFNGTAANVIALKSMLEPWEAVICARSSHLHLDECGAPEAVGGFKLLTVDCPDGKLTPTQIERELIRRGDQHYAQPRAVSITQPTEWGTLYSISELEALRAVIERHGLLLHIDGARLSIAACALKTSFAHIAKASGAHAISFGGTKNGLMGAEAVIVFSKKEGNRIRYLRKQMMQLPSKTRFLAAQFVAFFDNDYWNELARPAIETAQFVHSQLREIKHISVVQDVQANSVFVKLPRSWNKHLKDKAFFYVWDDHENIVRWMFAYHHCPDDLQDFIATLKNLDQESHLLTSPRPEA